MGPTQKILWSVYIGVVGTVATMAAQKAVSAGWKAATGKEPPSPTDPHTPLSAAAGWVAASAVGVGVAQLAASRFAAKRWETNMGAYVPSTPKVQIKA